MDNLLSSDFWIALIQPIWHWLQTEIFAPWFLIEIAVFLICIFFAWMFARPLKPKLGDFVHHRNWEHLPAGRFLHTLARLLNYVFLIVLMFFARLFFQNNHIDALVFDTVLSLLTAWVVIRLTTSVVREANWARFIAIVAWSVAALHILSLLNPTLVLLDKLALNLGGIRLSVLLVIKAVIILALLLKLALSASVLLEKRLITLEGLTPSVQVLISKALKFTLIGTAVVVALSSLGINLSAFAFIGGAVGVGIGFGLQKVVSNLVSGIILLLDRSLKPGDVIELAHTYGRIQSLGARYVSVVTRDGTEYLIPNEDLITQQVINWSFSNKLVRLKISVGVSYDSDIHEVMRLMIEAAGDVSRVLQHPKPVCQLKNFGDNAIDMELRIWVGDPENGISNVSSSVRLGIWDSFKKHGIEIPFPQRDLHIKSPPGRIGESV